MGANKRIVRKCEECGEERMMTTSQKYCRSGRNCALIVRDRQLKENYEKKRMQKAATFIEGEGI